MSRRCAGWCDFAGRLISRKARRAIPGESHAMTLSQPYDVLIAGAGPAGLALARALAGTRLRIGIIDRAPAETLAAPPCDGREIALTHRSIATLQRLGAWQRLDPAEIAPLREARVLNGGQSFALSFAGPNPGNRLGSLVSNQQIRRALFEASAPRQYHAEDLQRALSGASAQRQHQAAEWADLQRALMESSAQQARELEYIHVC